MGKLMTLFVILLCVSCRAPILRQAITGIIVDGTTDKPLPQATIYTYDGTTELAQSDGNGRFLISPVRDTHMLFPGEERGALAPNSDKICIKKTGYVNDTIFIFDTIYKKTIDTIQLDVVALQPLIQ
ncbi:hypothetical protein CLV59_104503 [Chitinophaga dinghuensis]|uniref:Carboxypeptidase regulatory-like domain-containing protein n=1 Tax=Chitinophaga dinghuensis TaxID=1539050 RepID=A0A327W8B3_9BACT|nr:hypothetical protein [Chitinophaga dinghuensis]RAJ82278.1 hypothetical protein CLV59_104503 [Chitinophaga dinghuensis]